MRMPACVWMLGLQELPESPASSCRNPFVLFYGLGPFISLPVGFVFGDAIALLNTPDQLVFFAGHHLPVAVGEFSPLLAGFTHHLFPVTFDCVPIHCGKTSAFTGANGGPKQETVNGRTLR